jgi:hypothetical protein
MLRGACGFWALMLWVLPEGFVFNVVFLSVSLFWSARAYVTGYFFIVFFLFFFVFIVRVCLLRGYVLRSFTQHLSILPGRLCWGSLFSDASAGILGSFFAFVFGLSHLGFWGFCCLAGLRGFLASLDFAVPGGFDE